MLHRRGQRRMLHGDRHWDRQRVGNVRVRESGRINRSRGRKKRQRPLRRQDCHDWNDEATQKTKRPNAVNHGRRAPSTRPCNSKRNEQQHERPDCDVHERKTFEQLCGHFIFLSFVRGGLPLRAVRYLRRRDLWRSRRSTPLRHRPVNSEKMSRAVVEKR